jgi:hypothetical protein
VCHQIRKASEIGHVMHLTESRIRFQSHDQRPRSNEMADMGAKIRARQIGITQRAIEAALAAAVETAVKTCPDWRQQRNAIVTQGERGLR